MKIGIYGGTFNPPHLGHMAAAVSAANVLSLDKLLLIPAGVPPHKTMAEGSASNRQRLEMTGLMADRLGLKIPVEVLSLEMDREGKSYTSMTLRELRAIYPEDELWLLMGTDMFLTFHCWYEPEVIARLAGLCAFGRTEKDGEALFAPQRDYLSRKYGARIVTLTLPNMVEASSTQIRQALAQGGGEDYLDPSIWGYILSNRLYGTRADLTQLSLSQLRAVGESMVRAKRIAHIRGTEETAAKMARRWGADETEARKAAILHDCTKYFTLQEQLSTCQKYGILLDDMEKTTLPLLHSKSAAGIARAVFGMSDEVVSAIFWHTTGRADMTLLEKILYIADYAEPTRKYSWAEQLRKLIETDLDAAVLRGLEITIEHTAGKGEPIHPRTLEARNWLLAHRKEA
ncbi:MAG: nicotinate (nicotinamide) nucleotide adenylyltransferase [Oscillospiraceae bacterium]|nr:nicotinate (nicotinamide) nucleotide adenylyltransferase [Oscillospiraceae bacterium]